MSPAWQYRADAKHAGFRAWLERLEHEVEELPAGTFKSSGISVRAQLVTIRG